MRLKFPVSICLKYICILNAFATHGCHQFQHFGNYSNCPMRFDPLSVDNKAAGRPHSTDLYKRPSLTNRSLFPLTNHFCLAKMAIHAQQMRHFGFVSISHFISTELNNKYDSFFANLYTLNTLMKRCCGMSLNLSQNANVSFSTKSTFAAYISNAITTFNFCVFVVCQVVK